MFFYFNNMYSLILSLNLPPNVVGWSPLAVCKWQQGLLSICHSFLASYLAWGLFMVTHANIEQLHSFLPMIFAYIISIICSPLQFGRYNSDPIRTKIVNKVNEIYSVLNLRISLLPLLLLSSDIVLFVRIHGKLRTRISVLVYND